LYASLFKAGYCYNGDIPALVAETYMPFGIFKRYSDVRVLVASLPNIKLSLIDEIYSSSLKSFIKASIPQHMLAILFRA
jgi:hypothetical protein